MQSAAESYDETQVKQTFEDQNYRIQILDRAVKVENKPSKLSIPANVVFILEVSTPCCSIACIFYVKENSCYNREPSVKTERLGNQ